MEIRGAKEQDKGTVLEFCKDTFSWGDYIADVWDKWLSAGRLYVLEEDGSVVGMYHIVFFAKEAWLEGMRVHPKYRQKGLGTKMMTHAESVIQKGTVRLVIESQNLPSIQLVKSVGYYMEEEWRLYFMTPEKQSSRVTVATNSQPIDHFGSSTYADSWRWLPIDEKEIEKLVLQGRILSSKKGEKISAVGIWNQSNDFPQTLQLGLVNGRREGMLEILRYVQNKAHEMNCDRIQVFAPEKTLLDASFLEKRSLFYLMKKELGKNL